MFTWRVSPENYEWSQCTLQSGDQDWFIHESKDYWKAEEYYEPMSKCPALFLTYANLDISRDSIMKFVNCYGLLGGSLVQLVELETGKKVGELLWTWRREHQVFSSLVKLWISARDHDLNALEKKIFWQEDTPIHIDWVKDKPDETGITYSGTGISGQFIKGDLIEPAKAYVLNQINSRLLLNDLVPAQLVKTGSGLKLDSIPTSLLGCMYLQFVNAIITNKEFRSCSICGEGFEVHPGAGGSNREHCSDACRMKAYRNRQYRAWELIKTGCSVEEIAVILDSSIEIIAKWLSKPEPKLKAVNSKKIDSEEIGCSQALN